MAPVLIVGVIGAPKEYIQLVNFCHDLAMRTRVVRPNPHRKRDATRAANSNVFPLMLLACSVDTPIHINRSYLLALHPASCVDWAPWAWTSKTNAHIVVYRCANKPTVLFIVTVEISIQNKLLKTLHLNFCVSPRARVVPSLSKSAALISVEAALHHVIDKTSTLCLRSPSHVIAHIKPPPPHTYVKPESSPSLHQAPLGPLQ